MIHVGCLIEVTASTGLTVRSFASFCQIFVMLHFHFQRGKYLMVRVPTDNEYGLWKVALESQTADNVKATYVRPAPASIPNPKKVN